MSTPEIIESILPHLTYQSAAQLASVVAVIMAVVGAAWSAFCREGVRNCFVAGSIFFGMSFFVVGGIGVVTVDERNSDIKTLAAVLGAADFKAEPVGNGAIRLSRREPVFGGRADVELGAVVLSAGDALKLSRALEKHQPALGAHLKSSMLVAQK